MMLAALFALSVAVFFFLLLRMVIRKKLEPQQARQRRMDELRHLNQRRQIDPIRSSRDIRAKKARSIRDIPFIERVVIPMQHSLERKLISMTPKEISHWLGHRLTLAGQSGKCTPAQLFATIIVSGGAMFLIALWFTAEQHYPFLQTVAVMLLAAGVGAAVPLVYLNMIIQRRQEGIMKQLPEVLDLLCVSVQAGLSFDASLHKITGRMKGPLVDEFRRFQDDVSMGMIRRTAMKNMAVRCELQDVSLFMTALIQAEKLGTSMGKTLRNQSDNIRERRRQYVKAQAMKAPVKIVFPLVLFIFPAIFVVALVPTLLSLMKNM